MKTKTLLAICVVLAGAGTAAAQDSKYPLYRSPNQKQADYQAAQAARNDVPQRVIVRQPIYLNDCYPYRYRGYRPYYGYRPAYPYYPTYRVYPPVYRTWPVTPYPFRIP